jgi:hypothetical protein
VNEFWKHRIHEMFKVTGIPESTKVMASFDERRSWTELYAANLLAT